MAASSWGTCGWRFSSPRWNECCASVRRYSEIVPRGPVIIGPREAVPDQVRELVTYLVTEAVPDQVTERRVTPRGDIDSTFDVWDERLAGSGTRLVEARETLVEQLVGPTGAAYAHLAGRESRLGLSYNRSWQGDLHDALREGRSDDLRHQATGRGPHRDELLITLDGMPARTHASQGEQRCVALALRLAAHELATEKFGEAPTLLLDDVFSELDDKRAALLAELLPPGQVLLATAVDPPLALAGNVVDVAEVRGSSRRVPDVGEAERGPDRQIDWCTRLGQRTQIDQCTKIDG